MIGWRPKEELQFKPEAHLLAESQKLIFVLLMCSTNWMRLTHIMEVHQWYPKKKKKTLTEMSRIVFDQISRQHVLAKWIHQINHHKH